MTVTYRYDNGLFDYVHFLTPGAKTIVNEEIAPLSPKTPTAT